MYSVILMMAITGSAETPEFGRRCNGCHSSCSTSCSVAVGCTGCSVAPAPVIVAPAAPVEVVGCCNGGGCSTCSSCSHSRHGHRTCGGGFLGGLFKKKHGHGCSSGCSV